MTQYKYEKNQKIDWESIFERILGSKKPPLSIIRFPDTLIRPMNVLTRIQRGKESPAGAQPAICF